MSGWICIIEYLNYINISLFFEWLSVVCSWYKKDEGRDFRWMLRVILMRIFHPVFEPGYGDPQSPGLDRLSYPHHKLLMCQLVLRLWCRGRDLNPRTPTRPGPKPGAFDQLGDPCVCSVVYL